MYAWLPAASVAPTPVTALLHAVAVVNAGAYAVLRVIYYSFRRAFPLWLRGADHRGVPELLYHPFRFHHGGARTALQAPSGLLHGEQPELHAHGRGADDPGGMVGSLLHLVFHGLMKIALFYCAGAVLVQDRQGVCAGSARLRADDALHLHGASRWAAFAMVGIPPAVRLREQVEPADRRGGHGLLVGRSWPLSR